MWKDAHGESDGDGTLESLVDEAVSHADVLEGLCALEDTMSSRSLGVDDSLGNALAVKVGEQIDKMLRVVN